MQIKPLPENVFLVETQCAEFRGYIDAQVAKLIFKLHQEIGTPLVEDLDAYSVVFEEIKGHPAKVVGFLVFEKLLWERTASVFYVSPEYRRKGIMTYLFDNALYYMGNHTTVGIQLLGAQPDGEAFAKAFRFWQGDTVNGADHWFMPKGLYQSRKDAAAERKAITDMKQYIKWTGEGSATIDGDFSLQDLRIIVSFMERGGPGNSYCEHKELKGDEL